MLTLGTTGAVFLLLVAVGPLIAAMVATRRADKSNTWEPLLALARWRAPPLTYACALLLPVGLLAISASVTAWFGASRAADMPVSTLSWGYVVQCLLANPLEEIGWRGFALPRFCARTNPVVASFIVGLAWALWHGPMFFWPDSPMHSYPVLAWAMLLIAESFILTWLYFRSGRSVLVVSVFHITMNLAGTILGVTSFAVASLVFALTAAALWWHSPPRTGQ